MVKRRLTLIIVGLLVGTLLLLAAGLYWVLATRAGAEWLLLRAAGQGGVRIETTVKGSLWSGLELSNLRISWPGGQATTDHLHLTLRPQSLLRGRVVIARLELGTSGISFDENTVTEPSRPPRMATEWWPQLPSWLFWVAADLQNLSVAELSLGSACDNPPVLTDLQANAHLADGVIQIAVGQLHLPSGAWDGRVHLDLSHRHITSDLRWRGAPVVADWDEMRTHVELNAALTGPLRAEVLAESNVRATLQAETALTWTGVTLTHLAVARSQAPDRVAGSLHIDWEEAFRLTADLQLRHLNLAAEAGWPTDLSGPLRAELTASGYGGSFDLESLRPGWERGRLAATVTGDWRGLHLAEMRGNWLDGVIAGALELDWREGFRLTGNLHGSGVNPATLVPGMSGQLQLTVNGDLHRSPAGELSANWDAELERSTLQNRPLAGRVAGRWQDNDLILDTLDLHGDGLRAKGEGRLSRRLDLHWQVDDLGRVGAGWQGTLTGHAWLARAAGQWRGGADGQLKSLRIGTVQAGAGQFTLDYAGAAAESHLHLTLARLTLPQGSLDEVVMTGSGRGAAHEIALRLSWPAGTLAGRFTGGWREGTWSGDIDELHGHTDPFGPWRLTAPAGLVLSRERLQLQSLQLAGDQGGGIDLTADVRPEPWSGSLRASWHDFPLDFLNPWLGGPTLTGLSSGEVQANLRPDGAMDLATELFATPVLRWRGGELALAPSHARVNWGKTGLDADGELNFAKGGRFTFTLRSPQSGRLALPERGEVSAAWEGIELRQLNPWLPETLTVDGRWQGDVAGRWQAGTALQLAGKTWIEDGALQWQGVDGLIRLPLRQAELTGSWQAGWAQGELHLALAEHGRIDGHFRLPLLTDNPDAPLQAAAHFTLDELGLLATLLPGATNETHGKLQGDLRLAGSRRQPQLYGRLALSGAGADVPALGLKLREVELDAAFDDTTVKIERLQLVSGKGRLEGHGELQLAGWRPQRWSLNLKGKDIELVNLPEITLEVTPDVQLSGTSERLVVRGEVLVPNLLIYQVPKTGEIEPSEDVILADAAPAAPVKLFTQLDVKLKLKLGEHVVIKAKGLDARLSGGVDVATDKHGVFVGQGEIKVEKGHYAAYGLNLPITRGRASFGGGAVQDPLLDVLAERKVGEVTAGVRVTGMPRKPIVTLVSTPAMPDTEVLAYIVLGRPLGTTGGQYESLMLATSALLSQGESAALQEKIKRQIGIDVLEVQSAGSDGVAGSMVAVGKYLTPELYLSFGQSLFTSESVARLRYQFGKRWQLESQLGTISGADLSYRIEFR